MDKDEYRRALKRLGLSTASKRTARYVGVSIRQGQGLASGERRVPRAVARLLFMYLRYGLPPEDELPD
jgi:hypothetical protein